MNILLIIKRFDFGGAENHVCDLANKLHDKGHRVTLITKKGRQLEKLNPIIVFKHIRLNDILLIFQVIIISLLIIRRKIDVIHAHQRLAIVASCLAGFITGRKVVSTIHGRSNIDLRSIFSRMLSSRMIFVSQKVMAESNKRWNIGHKSVYIPNGTKIKVSDCKAVPYRVCHFSRIDASHFSFLKFFITKVLEKLIKEHPLLEFRIYGDGKKNDELKTLANKFNISTNSTKCRVVGYVELVEQHYQKASLVLGVGRVALSAAAMGVPVLIVNSKKLGGLLSPENYKALTYTNFIDTNGQKPTKDKVAEIIHDFFARYEHWTSNAKFIAKQIQSDFSLDTITNKTIDVYYDLVAK